MSLEALAQKQDAPVVVPTVKQGKSKSGAMFWNFPQEQIVLKRVEMWFPVLAEPQVSEKYPTSAPKYSATFALGTDANSTNVQALYQAIQKIAERDFVEQTRKGGKVVSSLPLTFDKLKEPKLKLKFPKEDGEEDKQSAFVNQYYINTAMGAWGKVEVFKRSNELGKKIELMTPDEIKIVGNGSIVTANIMLQGYYIKEDNFGVKATLCGVLVNSAKIKGYQPDNASAFSNLSDDDFDGDDEDLGF